MFNPNYEIYISFFLDYHHGRQVEADIDHKEAKFAIFSKLCILAHFLDKNIIII